MVQFEMVGKLSLPKETEKFKNYEVREYASGWVNKTLSMNLISGDNRFMLRSKAGYFSDMHGDIYLFSKDSVDNNGNKVKGSAFTIPFKERLTHKRLPEVVEWKKFVVELEEPGYRWELQKALDKVKDGEELSEDEVKKFGASDVKGLEAALDKSNKKRKEYVSEYDFIDFVKKMIESGKYANRKFKVSGEYQMQYSDANNRFYSNYVPTRIYLAADDAEENATASLTLFFNQESLVDAKEEKNKYYVNGWVQQYDGTRKANIFAPYVVVIDANDNEKKVKKLVDMFAAEDDEVKEINVVVDLLDGAQRSVITLESLDEETQDNIMLGLTTLEDVQRELGGSMYGERITENRFSKLGRGSAKGSEITAYHSEDLVIKPIGNDNAFEEAEEESDSLFDDDDLFN